MTSAQRTADDTRTRPFPLTARNRLPPRPSRSHRSLPGNAGSATRVGITAYAMSSYSIGGWVERSAVLLFNSLFLFSLGRAYCHKHRGESLQKRRWLSCAIGILLGIATTRPIMAVFFATGPLTHSASESPCRISSLR
jgi:hypothetical protein